MRYMNVFNLWGDENALSYSRMPINKYRRDDGIRKSLLGNHLLSNSGKKH